MLNVYTVSFLGHRQVDHPLEIERRLETAVWDLLNEKEYIYIDFLVGRNGEFDILVASVIHRLKHTIRNDNGALILVLPYLTAEYENNRASFENYYDEIEVSDAAVQTHFKAAIQVRNREMIDRSDLVICYVQHMRGGAYQAMRYAEECGKAIINLAL